MLYVVRHGETEWNAVNKVLGRTDIPLNSRGIEQAHELARSLRDVQIDVFLCSPLCRARQTADAISNETGISYRIDDRLIEMDYGPYEGMDLTDPAPEVMAFFMDFAGTPAPDGMEQLDSVVGRLGEFLEEIRSEAMVRNILISTHAIAMKGALEYLTPESRGSYWSTYIGNCAVYVSDTSEGTYMIPYEITVNK